MVLTGPLPVFAVSQCCLCKSKTAEAQNVCAQIDNALSFTCNSVTIDGLDCSSVLLGDIGISDTKCKLVTSGGICNDTMSGAFSEKLKYTPTPKDATRTAGGSETTKIIEVRAPKLNVDIPGLQLTSKLTYKPGEKVAIPFLAQYIAGIYRYLMGLAVIASAVMIVYGGFKYILSATASGVQSGKETILNALIGLFITFGAYAILSTLNPQLLGLRPIELPTIKPELYVVPADQIRSITGKAPLSASEMKKLVTQKALAAGGINLACLALGSMAHESGGRHDVIGPDSDARILTFVAARHDFLASLTKFSGEKFELPDKCCIKDPKTKQETCKPVPQVCREGKCPTNNQEMKRKERNFYLFIKLPLECQALIEANNARFDHKKPPDYGLDWRFSYGFGAGQSTIFPWDTPCPGKDNQGRGFRPFFGGPCFPAVDLLTPEGSAEASVAHYKACLEGAKLNPEAAFGCYGANTKELLEPRMRTYNECVKSGDAMQFAAN